MDADGFLFSVDDARRIKRAVERAEGHGRSEGNFGGWPPFDGVPGFSGTVRFAENNRVVLQAGPWKRYLLADRSQYTWTTYDVEPVPCPPNTVLYDLWNTVGDIFVY